MKNNVAKTLTDQFRVTMSPLIEKHYGHLRPAERIKEAAYLRDVARQLELSGLVAIADRARRPRHPLRPLCRAKLARN